MAADRLGCQNFVRKAFREKLLLLITYIIVISLDFCLLKKAHAILSSAIVYIRFSTIQP
jgi:hypothetical protein